MVHLGFRSNPRLRRAALLLLGCWAALLATAAPGRAASGHATAHATSNGLGTVSMDQPSYVAHEDQGFLQITIVRTGDLGRTQHIGFGVAPQDAQPGIDFDIVPGTVVAMAPGQSTYTFQVPIIDQGMHGTPVHARAYLYGASPAPLGDNSTSIITILHDDPLQPRDPANPLGVAGPVNGNPIAGTHFYVDPNTGPAKAAQEYASSRPAWSRLLSEIAAQPGAHRFYMWNMGPNVAGQVAHYLEGTQVQQPGTTVMLSTYSLVHDHCGYTATPAMAARYHAFMSQVAKGIGNFHVVFFLELDALITAPCLNHRQLAIREGELRDAIRLLERDPHVVVYVDGGAADAVPLARQARYLRDSGVRRAQGFFLNSTHFDWTSKELSYGQAISRRLGGVHFVINTGENGRGPLVPRDRVHQGNEVLCNPPGRGLGPLSLHDDVAEQTGYVADDGLLWFSNPGGSGGPCRPGAPPTAVYWPAYAVMLARNWVNRVTGPGLAWLARVHG